MNKIIFFENEKVDMGLYLPFFKSSIFKEHEKFLIIFVHPLNVQKNTYNKKLKLTLIYLPWFGSDMFGNDNPEISLLSKRIIQYLLLNDKLIINTSDICFFRNTEFLFLATEIKQQFNSKVVYIINNISKELITELRNGINSFDFLLTFNNNIFHRLIWVFKTDVNKVLLFPFIQSNKYNTDIVKKLEIKNALLFSELDKIVLLYSGWDIWDQRSISNLLGFAKTLANKFKLKLVFCGDSVIASSTLPPYLFNTISFINSSDSKLMLSIFSICDLVIFHPKFNQFSSLMVDLLHSGKNIIAPSNLESLVPASINKDLQSLIEYAPVYSERSNDAKIYSTTLMEKIISKILHKEKGDVILNNHRKENSGFEKEIKKIVLGLNDN